MTDPDRRAVSAAVATALADGSWHLYRGPHVPHLEALLADAFGVPHAVSCASGTLASEIALRAAGVGDGDEVVMAAYDYEPSFLNVHAVGGRPVLIDIDPATGCLDPHGINAALSPLTKAVLVSHLHGGLAPMARLRETADRHGLCLIEDAAQAPGAVVEGRPAGSWGDIGVLSFGGSKLLSSGRGGAVLCRAADSAQRVRLALKRGNQDWGPLSELQAVALIPQVERLAERTRQRADAVRVILDAIASIPGMRPFAVRPGDRSAFYKVGFWFDADAFGLSRAASWPRCSPPASPSTRASGHCTSAGRRAATGPPGRCRTPSGPAETWSRCTTRSSWQATRRSAGWRLPSPGRIVTRHARLESTVPVQGPSMHRLAAALLGWLAAATAAPAAPADFNGRWLFPLALPTNRGEQSFTFLIALSESDGKWTGDFLEVVPPIKVKPTVEDISTKDDVLKFTFRIGDRSWLYEGRPTKAGKKVAGSVGTGRQASISEMSSTKIKSFDDSFTFLKERLDSADGAEFFEPLFPVLSQAAAKKMKAEDVRAVVDRATKLAEEFGPRWQKSVALRLADKLGETEAYLPIAIEQARQAERLMVKGDDIATQMEILDTIARVLRKAKKADELKEVETRIVRLEPRDYADYAKKNPPFKPEEFKGRKAKSDRAVLVELFTGAECPPCVAVDLACDALERTYKPAEAIFLQYHIHVPGPDPLANKDTEERAAARKVEGTPATYFNGKTADTDGGGLSPKDAREKYDLMKKQLEDLLEKPAGAKVAVTAALKGEELSIKATVSDVEKPGDKVTLRIALAETRVRYSGSNGIRYHHGVVRALVGGQKGYAVKDKALDQTATVKLDELRASLVKYLDDYGKDNEFPSSDRPLDLKDLKVVAFVQDDATGEVLQAAQVEIEAVKQ